MLLLKNIVPSQNYQAIRVLTNYKEIVPFGRVLNAIIVDHYFCWRELLTKHRELQTANCILKANCLTKRVI